MTPRRPLIGLLFAATVLVDLVAWSFIRSHSTLEPPWLHAAERAFIALACSQTSLLALWVGFAATPQPWRLVGMTLAIVGWSRLVISVVSVHGPEKDIIPTLLVAVLSGQAVCLLAAVLIARVMGWTLAPPDKSDSSLDAPAVARPMQFTLGCLLAWLTAAAVILGTMKYATDPGALSRGLSTPILKAVLLVGVPSDILAIAVFVAALGTGRARHLLLGLVTAAVIAFDFWLLPGKVPWNVAIFYLTQLAWLLGSLWVVREAGYRIRWRGGTHLVR